MWTQLNPHLLFTVISLSFAISSIAAPSSKLVRNRDFESPPTNITANSTSPFLQLTAANTIPGWSHRGTVRYVSPGPNISLPGNGHAVQLGPGGKINQTIIERGDGGYGYVLSFILVPSSKECFNNFTAVNVSVPGTSKVFFLNGHYGKKMWETHGLSFSMGVRDPFNLIIEKVSTQRVANLTCDPIIDEFLVRRFGPAIVYSDSMVANHGFEEGPGFTGNYSEGILLQDEPDYLHSPLQQWAVLGTVKYIDSKHYKVPKGNAAVELLTGDPSGISTNVWIPRNSESRLEFTVADAKDSCLTNFTVFARAGSPTTVFVFGEKRVETIRSFTMTSNGTGSVWRYSMPFKVELEETEISIYSSKQSQTRDGVFCGPVIDNVKILYSASSANLPLSIITFLSWVLIELVLKNTG